MNEYTVRMNGDIEEDGYVLAENGEYIGLFDNETIAQRVADLLNADEQKSNT